MKLGQFLFQFKNLRILCTTITEGVLEAFSFLTNLQELHLEQNVWRELENKQLMEQLLSKRSELKRDVKIYFNDILIANHL